MTSTQEATESVPAHAYPFTTSFGHNLSASASSDTFCRYADAALAEERHAQAGTQAEGPVSHVPESQLDQLPSAERSQPFPSKSDISPFGERGRSYGRSFQQPVGYSAETSLSPSSPVQSPLRSPPGGDQTGNPSRHPGYFVPSRPSQAHIAGHSGTGATSSSLPEAIAATDHMHAPNAAEPATVCRKDFNEVAADDHQTVPLGNRFRRHSLQVAAKVVHTHIQRPGGQPAGSSDNSQSLPLLQGCSDCVHHGAHHVLPLPNNEETDEEDIEDVEAGTAAKEPPVGVLGIILDLYKVQADCLLEADLPEEETSSTRSTSHGSSKANSANGSSTEQPLPLRRGTLDSGTMLGASTSGATSLASTHSSAANSIGPTTRKKGQPGRARLTGKEKRRWHDEQTVSRVSEAIRSHITRQMYLMKLCRALMTYGAPTHRLEAYMATTARALSLNAQFMYLPNCMVISFIDDTTQTTKVSIVTAPQSIDLGRMRDTHETYLGVVYKMLTLDEGMDRLEVIMAQKPKFNVWFRVLTYGFACASVAMFGFDGRFIDLPFAFVLGVLLGIMHLILVPGNYLFSNVFEVVASILITFLARAFGSSMGGSFFCFSALAQSGIALILPGYVLLCSALELQTKHLVAGSVRLLYTVFYMLMIGYGITIGSVLYGYMDRNAISETSCPDPLAKDWSLLFVTIFTICVAIINQTKWKQLPVMIFISVSGYIVQWRAAAYFQGASTVSNTLGALTIGVLANLYSRLRRHPSYTVDMCNRCIARSRKSRRRKRRTQNLDPEKGGPASSPESSKKVNGSLFISKRHENRVGYGLASAAMLPAIFVQVPSGIAVGGSLIAGVTSADWIVSDEVGETAIEDIAAASGIALNVMASTVQVAVSISIGLALSALIVYPMEWRRRKRPRKAGVSSL